MLTVHWWPNTLGARLVHDAERGETWVVLVRPDAWGYRLPWQRRDVRPTAENQVSEREARLVGWVIGLPDAERPTPADLVWLGSEVLWLRQLSEEMAA